MSLSSLTIGEMVLHGVPGRGSLSNEVTLSDVPSVLNDGQRQYIQGRIRGALARQARPILEEMGRPLPAAVREMFLDSASLVPKSRDLALLLDQVQPAISPAGIIVVANGSLEGNQALVLAKLEHELGVRAHQTTLAGGELTYDVELIQDLLFTEQSHVFKVAVFTVPAEGEPLRGFMVDNQAASHSIARFFLTSFLGCVLAERSDVLTEKFQNATELWINQVPDPSLRARYEIALISELQSNASTLSATGFASRHLDLVDRDDYEAFMGSQGVPQRSFDKDTTLVANRLNRIRLDTESGVTVIGAPNSYEDGTISLNSGEDGDAVITVRDRLQLVSGRGRGQRLSATAGAGAGQSGA
jgi:hypothetical protein